MQITIPRVSVSEGLGWGLRRCISVKLSDDANATSWALHSEDQ